MPRTSTQPTNASSRTALLALLALTSTAAVPGVAHAQQRRGLPAPATTSLPEETTEAPMLRYELLPLVEVSINGEGPYRLVLDTGASGVVLHQDAAQRLALPSPPGMPEGMQTRVMSPGGPIQAALAYIEELQFAGATWNGVWTIATEMPFGDSIDGVIGMDLFRTATLTYDYPNGTVRIGPDPLAEPDDQTIFSYQTVGGTGTHPTLTMQVGQEPTEFLIDTGFRGWFMVPPSWTTEHTPISGPVDGQPGLSTGGPVPLHVARITTPITLGQYRVENPVIRMPAKPMGTPDNNILGTSFLENFVVTFDGPNHRIQFANGPADPFTPAALRYLGLGLKQVGDNLEIWSVHPDAHAHELGLNVGDLIHTINDSPAVEFYRSLEGQRALTTSESFHITLASPASSEPRELNLRTLELLPAAP